MKKKAPAKKAPAKKPAPAAKPQVSKKPAKIAKKKDLKAKPKDLKAKPVKPVSTPAAKATKGKSSSQEAKKGADRDADFEPVELDDGDGGENLDEAELAEIAVFEAEEEDLDDGSDSDDDSDDDDDDDDEVVPEEASGDIVLTDAEGNRYCRARDCDQIAVVDAYCRYHYLLFWKKIQVRKKILTDGKLERYVDELTARYPDKFLEMIRRDLRTEKDFVAAIQELEIDESGLENEYEEDTQSFIDEVRGMGEGSGGGEGVEDDF